MNCDYSPLSTGFQQWCQAESAAVSRHCATFQDISRKYQTRKILKSAQCGSESHHQHQLTGEPCRTCHRRGASTHPADDAQGAAGPLEGGRPAGRAVGAAVDAPHATVAQEDLVVLGEAVLLLDLYLLAVPPPAVSPLDHRVDEPLVVDVQETLVDARRVCLRVVEGLRVLADDLVERALDVGLVDGVLGAAGDVEARGQAASRARGVERRTGRRERGRVAGGAVHRVAGPQVTA